MDEGVDSEADAVFIRWNAAKKGVDWSRKETGEENVDFNCVNSWNHGSSSSGPAQRKKQRVWDVHRDGGGAVSFLLCGGKAGSDSKNTSDAGILHRNQPGVSVGTFENGGNHLYFRICLRDL